MERQCAGVDAKEGPAAYNFNAPIAKVEGIVRRDGFRLEDRLIAEVGCIVCGGFRFKDRLVVGTIGNREVGQGGDAR